MSAGEKQTAAAAAATTTGTSLLEQAIAQTKQTERNRSQDLIKAGRPICPMCSQPKDPEGHFCPRSNGHAHTEV